MAMKDETDETLLPCPFCGLTNTQLIYNPMFTARDTVRCFRCRIDVHQDVWKNRTVTEAMVNAGAALSTTGRENNRNYRKRIYRIIEAALNAKE